MVDLARLLWVDVPEPRRPVHADFDGIPASAVDSARRARMFRPVQAGHLTPP